MPRFVLLDHDYPVAHLDLMLEASGGLWTWRLTSLPECDVVQIAERIGDHRLIYLDYEGPVSGNRGYVTRRDHGVFEWVERCQDLICVELTGHRLKGRLTLTHDTAERWLLRYIPMEEG